MTDDLVLTINGTRWRGWTEVSVTRSIEAVAAGFQLTLTDKAGTPDTPLRLDVTPGAPCTVEIEGDAGRAVLFTGYVDDVEPAFSAAEHTVRVAGRSAAGDLVDCSAVHAPSGEFHDADALQIARALAKPFGIDVTAEVAVGLPFKTFRIQEGETVWEAIERACRCRGLLCMSGPRGGVVLTRGSAAPRTGVTLTCKTILEGRGAYSMRDRYSEITVKGQAALDDPFSASAAAGPKVTVNDVGAPRHRPLIVVAEDLAEGQTLADRGAFEANVRAARARRAEVTVQGWRLANGALWQPLTLVTIKEPWLGLDAEMLIAGVTFTRDGRRGTRTTLSLVGRKAFDVLPVKDKTDTEGLGW